MDPAHDGGIGGAAFDELDEGGERMRFDCLAIVRANLDVDADHPTAAQDFAQAG